MSLAEDLRKFFLKTDPNFRLLILIVKKINVNFTKEQRRYHCIQFGYGGDYTEQSNAHVTLYG